MRCLLLSLSIATSLASSIATFGQTELPCGTDSAHIAMLESSPDYGRSLFAVQAAIERMRAENRVNMDVYTLPVVVHVIHRGSNIGEAENISDEQIFSAIQALNEDFRKMPGTPGDGLGVDTYIQFELAKRTPNDEPTNGIVRVDGRSFDGFLDHGIAMDATQNGANEMELKSATTWGGADYVNFFVVPEINGNNGGNGIQGYAYLAPTGNALDGITILSNVFGTVGNLKPTHNMSRTTTHETGHYLGLFHTFWMTLTCNAESNCATQGDQICDTPATTANSSCLNADCEGAQVENYMDYTPQTCRNTYTEGQRERMRATLESSRASLLQSLALVPVSDHDLVVTSVIDPASSTCLGTTAPSVRVFNQGTESTEGFEIHFSINGGDTLKKSFDHIIPANGAITVELPGMSFVPGTNELVTIIKQLGQTDDDFPANDTLRHAFTLDITDYWTMTLTTDIWYTETSWMLEDSLGQIIWSGDDYTAALTDYVVSGCIPLGCHTLTIDDAANDGMTWGGAMVLTNGHGEVIAEMNDDNSNFGSQLVFEVCGTPADQSGCLDSNGNGICDEDEIAGCQDPLACNWNPLALLAGETCTYSDGIYDCDGFCLEDTDGDGVCDPLEIPGCMDGDACNFDASATDDNATCFYADAITDCDGQCFHDGDGDGVCDEFEVEGCQDLEACNYDTSATDAGICEYPESGYDCQGQCILDTDDDGVCDEFEVEGCTDMGANNYNPAATDNDGSCTYDTDGCMDETACNYNPQATVDNGNCEYPDAGFDCLGNATDIFTIDNQEAITAFPNPFLPEHNMVFLMGLTSPKPSIQLISTEGRVVWEGEGIPQGVDMHGFPIRDHVSSGTYFIRIGSSTSSGTIPLIVW
jgi:hypothetical protein